MKSAQHSSCCFSSLVPHLPVVSLLTMLLRWRCVCLSQGWRGTALVLLPQGCSGELCPIPVPALQAHDVPNTLLTSHRL